MAIFVQVIGWLAFLAGGIAVFGGFVNESGWENPQSMIMFGAGAVLIFQGALLCVFGEMAADTRAMRKRAETA